MKKGDKIILIIYIIVGIVLVTTGLIIHIDYYSTLIFAMGFSLICSSIVQFIRFYHNTKPENIEAYREKIRQQSINLKDERKVQLRDHAGYLTWKVTTMTCFIAAFIAALFRAGALIVGILTGLAVAQYIAATIIYKYLCKKR